MSNRTSNLKNRLLVYSIISYRLLAVFLLSCPLDSYAMNSDPTEQEQEKAPSIRKPQEKNRKYMDPDGIRAFKEGSFENKFTFRQVVQQLKELGAESYIADLTRLKFTIYGSKGDYYEEVFPSFGALTVSTSFSPEQIKNNILNLGQEKITYIDFLKGIASAGVSRYQVFLEGGKAIYSGRHGDYHEVILPSINK